MIDGEAAARQPGSRLPGIAVAACASIGAGAIHAAASGAHSQDAGVARLLILCGIVQLAVGMFALYRPARMSAIAITVIDVAAVTGWLVTRTTGVSWISGLEVREVPQFADTVCGVLGIVAIGAAAGAILVGRQPGTPQRLGLPCVAVAALTIPAMILSGTHSDSHVHAATATTVATAAAPLRIGPTPVGTTTAGTTTAGTITAVSSTTAAIPTASQTSPATSAPTTALPSTSAPAPWPRPWDPGRPVDLSGVPGVTAEQTARATELVEQTLSDLPRWADPATAIADGYTSIGDAGTGDEHYIKASLIEDGVILDPTQPESLVYSVVGDQRTLAGAMFIAPAQATDAPDLVAWAGPLMTWHNHGNLCWDQIGGVAKVVGIVDGNGNCARGVHTGGANPMVHVWIVARPCGVFSALEGVGAGQAAVPDDQRVDECQADMGDMPGMDMSAGS